MADEIIEEQEQGHTEDESPAEKCDEPTESGAENTDTNEDTDTQADAEDVEVKDEDKENTEEEQVDLSKVENKEELTKALEDKGFNYEELCKEYNETGEISKETREKLEKVGITSEVIDKHIEGEKAKYEAEVKAQKEELATVVGGTKELETIIEWASNNLEEAEKNEINAITSMYAMKLTLKDLKQRMEEKEGINPTYTKGEAGQPAMDLFESKAQMMEAIRDNRYKTDEAYRAKVAKKIAASREAGKDLGI